MATAWYLKVGQREFGPLSATHLKRLAQERQIDAGVEFRRGTAGPWILPADPGEIVRQVVAEALEESIAEASQAIGVSPKPPVVYGSPTATDRPGAAASIPRFPVKRVGHRIRRSNPWSLAAEIGAAAAIVALASLFAYSWGQHDAPMAGDGGQPLIRHTAFRAGSPQMAPGATLEQIVAAAEPSVAMVKNSTASGTGFLIRPGVLVTNKHVLKSGPIKSFEVSFPSAEPGERGPYPVKLLYEHESRDLAFLAVETDLPPLRPAANFTFRRGQEIVVLGNPGVGPEMVLQNAISRGVMSTELTYQGEAYYQLSVSINPGNSGGPVLDAQGCVVGVVAKKAAREEGLGFCVPLEQLEQALARLDSLQESDYGVAESFHLVRGIFTKLAGLGDRYKLAITSYAETVETTSSLEIRQSALTRVQEKSTGFFRSHDADYFPKLEDRISKVSNDGNLPASVRQMIVDLWKSNLELKNSVDAPEEDAASYIVKSRELLDRYETLVDSLSDVLKIDRYGD